ncbi:MAG: F420-dependent NADP oxidoreductase [Bacteroidota bacterium]|nr:DUF2520 domain-containing protein [Odoribacter sp.]MDP3644199.1 F420-dependent NADP oxidoreductase [Bacteroidota bacterium]
MIENVVIIGSGNLATQLALALIEKGIRVKQVYSRSVESARLLAEKVNASFTNDLSQLIPEADLYVIAVKDSAIQEVLENLSLDENQLIVHTAGSVPMNILEGFTHNYGVFYPLQTFSKSRKVDFSDIPVCIEANHPSSLLKLEKLGERISNTVNQINSDERKTLHLAAVFTNNFVNHFYAIGAEILQVKKLDFDLLKPLIRETAAKIENIHPLEAQTGPAKRNDKTIIGPHLKMLQDKPEYQKIYSFVTESIFQVHQK